MCKPKVAFIGSGDWANAMLPAVLKANLEICAIISSLNPVCKELAERQKINFHEFTDWETCKPLFNGIDLGISAGWKKIPSEILDLPRNGFANIHGSLLPRYQGPEPLECQYINGESTIGVTIHKMTPEFDKGPIYAQQEITADPESTLKHYFIKLVRCGTKLISSTISDIALGTRIPAEQIANNGSYYPFLKPEAGQIDWNDDIKKNVRIVNCLGPRGWVRINCNGKIYTITQAQYLSTPIEGVNAGNLLCDETSQSLILTMKDGAVRMEYRN